MTIIPYNAAELYLESRTSDSALQVAINKDNYIKTIEIQGMNVDIFTQENTGDTAIDTDLSPLLRYLDENGNGDYTLLDPGEEEECISVYVIDKDRLDSAYMEYFDTGAAAADTPELYVKVKE